MSGRGRVAALVLLSALALPVSARAAEGWKDHILLINVRGFLVKPTESLADIEEQGDLAEQEVALLLSKAQGRRILIFVQGGMDDFADAKARAEDSVRVGAIEQCGYDPIFVGWNANLWSTYFQGLWLYRRGMREKFNGPITSPFVFLSEMISGAANAPVTWFHQVFETDWRRLEFDKSAWNNSTTDFPSYGLLNFEPQVVNREYTAVRDLHPPEGEELRVSLNPYVESKGRAALDGATYFASFWPKLATSPLISTLGQAAWDRMQGRIQSMFHPDQYFDRRQILFNHSQEQAYQDAMKPHPSGFERDTGRQALAKLRSYRASGGLNIFLRQLEGYQRRTKNKITLVGHSMGAIVASQIIERYPRLEYDRILFLAAACSLNEFERSVIPYLEMHPETHFFNLTLHPDNEVAEGACQPRDVLAERGSLLEWIDNFYSDPTHFMDRMLGKWDNVVPAISAIPDEIRPRIEIKGFGVDKTEHFSAVFNEAEFKAHRIGGPQEHGDFPSWPYWEPWFYQAEANPPRDRWDR